MRIALRLPDQMLPSPEPDFEPDFADMTRKNGCQLSRRKLAAHVKLVMS